VTGYGGEKATKVRFDNTEGTYSSFSIVWFFRGSGACLLAGVQRGFFCCVFFFFVYLSGGLFWVFQVSHPQETNLFHFATPELPNTISLWCSHQRAGTINSCDPSFPLPKWRQRAGTMLRIS